MSVRDKQRISADYKHYYLQKYACATARETLCGVFYRNNDEAHQDAWNRLLALAPAISELTSFGEEAKPKQVQLFNSSTRITS